MRWMMLMMLGACAVDGEPLDTADPEPPPLECPEGERYELAARLCGGQALAVDGDNKFWLWGSPGGCSYYEPSTREWGISLHSEHAEWWEVHGPDRPEGRDTRVVMTLTWRVDPSDDLLPERLVLQGTEQGKPFHCATGAPASLILVRMEGF